MASAKNVSELMGIIDSKFIRKYTYAIYGGNENLHQQVLFEDIHKIDFQKVEALRNVEGDIYSGRAELLHDVLGYFWIITLRQAEKQKKKSIRIYLRKGKSFTRALKNIESLIKRIEDGKIQL